MTASYTLSDTAAFTRTNARHIAAKVGADLKRMQRFYGKPSDKKIEQFQAELIEFLYEGYLETVTYGFRRDGNWIVPMLRYTAKDLAGVAASDDDPGRVLPGADISGASFYSYLTYSAAWNAASSAEQEAFRKRLPLVRTSAPDPELAGYLQYDRTYSSGGRGLERASLRSY